MAAHRRVVVTIERFHSWLDSSLFPEAAEKVAQELARQRKLIDQAAAARGTAARASIKEVATPEALVKVASDIGKGADTFKVQESLHARIYYRAPFEDARVHTLLEFVEDAIEGFGSSSSTPTSTRRSSTTSRSACSSSGGSARTTCRGTSAT